MGASTLAEMPALMACMPFLFTAANEIFSRAESSALAITSAMGERQVLALHTNKSRRTGFPEEFPAGTGAGKPAAADRATGTRRPGRELFAPTTEAGDFSP